MISALELVIGVFLFYLGAFLANHIIEYIDRKNAIIGRQWRERRHSEELAQRRMNLIESHQGSIEELIDELASMDMEYRIAHDMKQGNWGEVKAHKEGE